jgi:uncharacterized membrane-anchored protein YjiN (DUF445 family)
MIAIDKAAQLRKHKTLATGLFLLMLLVYIAMAWLSHHNTASWIGYVKAFSEAAMVGALADWFAVTALFHHPLGIPIPHTNLIENSKKSIGDNLGAFVVSNFLTADNIRPYIYRLTVASYAGDWLSKEKNKDLLVREATVLLQDIIGKLDDASIAKFIARKGGELLEDVKLNVIVANALHYFLDKGEHENLVSLLAQKIRIYISENEEVVRDKVKSESYFFIPKFVDNKLASKITNGLASYFGEIETDPSHRIRAEITAQLYTFAAQLKTEPKWEEEFRGLRNGLLSPEKLEAYAAAAWQSLKATLQQELAQESSSLTRYFTKTIGEFAHNLKNDPILQQRIDGWIHVNAYKYILRNTTQVATLISNTVGNWQGRELSRKLELEVGKDLQFIRINGTLVGGLVGLLIYSITEWIG